MTEQATDQGKRPLFATVELEVPVVRGESTIETLQLRRPNSGELRGLSMAELLRMETGAVMAVLPRISNPPLIDAEVAALDPADLFACAVEVSSFFMTRRELAGFPTT